MPNISTHFQILSVGEYVQIDLTIGKVYKIDRWQENAFFFKDDSGDVRGWTEEYAEVKDVSFYTNLEEVLK